jgi:hypothetical protein
LIIFLSGINFIMGQSATDADEIIQKIESAEKIEQLYSARYNLEKLSSRPELPVDQFRIVLNAHLKLTNAFKARNHYRNAVLVYMDYLQLVNVFHQNYSKYLADSITLASNKQITAYKNNVDQLDTEIASLTKRNVEVSGLRQKYFTYGGISAAIILAIFIFILLNRNKAIRETNRQIESKNLAMRALFKDVVKASVLSGTILYSRNVLRENSVILEELIVAMENNKEVPLDANTVNALKGAKIIATSEAA